MGRKPRDDNQDSIYHVICRGNNGEMIFSNNNDKARYMSIIKRYKKKFDIKIYAYCMMDNHLHLLVHRMNDPMYKFMQCVQQTYTQHYNKLYGRSGHVFQQRYKSIPCRKDSYFLELIKYIHLNPVRAHFDDGIKYFWSSHRIYSNGLPSDVVDTNYIYSLFGDKFKSGLKGYNKFMEEKTDLKCILKGDYELKSNDSNISTENYNKGDNMITLNEIIRIVCYEYGESDTRKVRLRNIRKYEEIRRVIILVTQSIHYISNKELSKELGLTSESISTIRTRSANSKLDNLGVIEKVKKICL